LIYEVCPSYHGLGWSAFFQSSCAGSSGAGEILLLWRDGSALSLPSGSNSLFCLSYSFCFGDDTPFCKGRVVVAHLFSDKLRAESPFCFGPYGATASDASPNSILIRGVPGNDSGAFTSVL
jgi:hypothetical protein